MFELLVILGTLAADLLSKSWAAGPLAAMEGGTLPLIEGVFHLTYVQNTGAAFGIFRGQRWPLIVLTSIATIAVAYVLITRRKKFSLWLRLSLALIVSGALGNLIDRAFLGYVRDLFDFRLINFAIFNVADVCICVAAALLMICIFFIDGKEQDGKAAPGQSKDQQEEEKCSK